MATTQDLSYQSIDLSDVDFVCQGLDNLLCQYNRSYDPRSDFEVNNIRKYLKILLEEVQTAAEIGVQLDGILDIDNLSGPALDFVGSLVGIDRVQCSAICVKIFGLCDGDTQTTGENPPIPPSTNLSFDLFQGVGFNVQSDPFTSLISSPITLASENLPDGVTFTDNMDGTFNLSGTIQDFGNFIFLVTATDTTDSSTVTQTFSIQVQSDDVFSCPQFTTDTIDKEHVESNSFDTISIRSGLSVGNLMKVDNEHYTGYKTVRNNQGGFVTPNTVEEQVSINNVEHYSEVDTAHTWIVEFVSGDNVTISSNYNFGDETSSTVNFNLFASTSDVDDLSMPQTIEKSTILRITFMCDSNQNILQKDVCLSSTYFYFPESSQPFIPSFGGGGGGFGGELF